MHKQTPTDSQIDVLMSDWLGNLRMKKEGNYIHKGSGGIRKTEPTTMRQYLLGNVRRMDELDLMKNARIGAEKIVNTVTPHPVKISLGTDMSLHSKAEDGREIISLATDYFEDSTLTNDQKVDILFGLASHEAAHSAYTDSSLTERELEKEDPRLQQLKHNIWNIIEDERIEYHLGEDRPGLADCVGATKGYYFDRLVERMKTDGHMPTEPIPKLVAAITQAVRYPSEMTREQVIDNFDELDAVRTALTPYPLSPEEAWEATERVMDIIRDKAEEEIEKQQQQDQQQDGGDGKSQDDKQTPKEKDEEDSSSSSAKPDKNAIAQAIADAMQTKQGQAVMEAVAEDNMKTNPDNKCAMSSEQEDYVNDDDSERMGAGGGCPNTFVKKPKGSPEKYNQSLSKVRKYIPAMARVLTCKSEESEYVLLGQPRGKLDTNKLVSFLIGNDNIFRKEGRVTCSGSSVCMLIDESGSMSGPLCQAAREAAILVNEAVKRIRNVNFFCYGYTTNRLNVYAEAGRTSPWALSETCADSGTPTGTAMQLAAERVRRFSQDPVLMLVLTDGYPDNNDKVLEADTELRRKKFIPIGVGILTDDVRNGFKEYLIMDDISRFAQEMGKLTKNKLNKMLVRTDSNNG